MTASVIGLVLFLYFKLIQGQVAIHNKRSVCSAVLEVAVKNMTLCDNNNSNFYTYRKHTGFITSLLNLLIESLSTFYMWQIAWRKKQTEKLNMVAVYVK